MPKDCSKECVLRAETTGTGPTDPTHHEHPQVSGNLYREPVHYITYIGVEGEESSRGYIRSGTRFFTQVCHAFRNGNNPFCNLWR
jgi:hypothetical protein